MRRVVLGVGFALVLAIPLRGFSQSHDSHPATLTASPPAAATASPPGPSVATPPGTTAISAPPAAADSAFALRPIDRATVRILSIRGVGATRARGLHTGRERLIASPDGAHGSGVVLSADGLVLTARHVVADADILAVIAPGANTAFPARIVYSDPEHDIAFLAVDGHFADFYPLPAAVPPLHALERVTASGYPLDPTQRTPAATSGEISRVNDDGRYQLAMSLNPGNSGGPVLDEHDALIGVVSQGGDPTQGVQGLVLVEPLPVILAAYHAHVEHEPLGLAAGVDLALEHDIADLAAGLVRAGPFGLAVDVGVHERLIALSRRTTRSDVRVLLAAHAWNSLVVLIERYGVTNIDALSPDARADAIALWDFTVEQCRGISTADARASTRYPFVAAVLQAADVIRGLAAAQSGSQFGCGAANQSCCGGEYCNLGLMCASGQCAVQPTCDATGACPGDLRCAAGRCEPPPHLPRVGFVLTAAPLVDTAPGASAIDGFSVDAGLLVRVVTFGPRQPWQVSAIAGADGQLGFWRGSVAAAANLDLGVRFRVGGHVGAAVTALYTPGVIYAEGRTAAAYKAYRLGAGLSVGNVGVGVSWQEQGRAADSTYRALGVYLEVGY